MPFVLLIVTLRVLELKRDPYKMVDFASEIGLEISLL